MAKLRVAVIGLGSMGLTHLDVYATRKDVAVVAVASRSGKALVNKPKGNIAGQAAGGSDLASVPHVTDAESLIRDPSIDVIDLCLPTPDHARYAALTLRADKHLLVEKPLALTTADCRKLVTLEKASKSIAMVGLCVRFWPGWTWLKQAIDKQTFGAARSAHFTRLCKHPGPNFADPARTGGALLDLHLHDTDFVRHCFGEPSAVTSRGNIDHVTTQYAYDNIAVTAEGGWTMAAGFPFTMRYVVNFTRATAVFDLAGASPLTLYRGGKATPIKLPPGLGYAGEIDYFLKCVKTSVPPAWASLCEAFASQVIVEAEGKSLRTGKTVSLARTTII